MATSANFVDRLIASDLAYVNDRTERNTFPSSLVGFAARRCVSPRSAAYYTILPGGALLRFSGYGIGRRNKCNQAEATIRRRDFGAFRCSSATCRTMTIPAAVAVADAAAVAAGK